MIKISIENSNVGGLNRIIAIPVDNISQYRKNYTTGSVSLRLIDSTRNIEIECEDGFEFTESLDNNDDYMAYNVNISGFINFIEDDKIKYLKTLAEGLWLVVHIDNNGKCFLSGTMTVPLLFTYTRSTGKNGSAKNSAQFSFTAIEPEASVSTELSNIYNI